MTEKFRPENKEEAEKGVFYKELRCITPEAANRLGIMTEAPVFVSQAISEGKSCPDCGRNYTPLTYRVGDETWAQHLHKQSGGIYHYGVVTIRSPEEFLGRLSEKVRRPFLAVLKPSGLQYSQVDIGNRTRQIVRSQAVRVESIYGYDPSSSEAALLQEGVLVEASGGETLHPYPLTPDFEKNPGSRFTFRNLDGEMFFSVIRHRLSDEAFRE